MHEIPKCSSFETKKSNSGFHYFIKAKGLSENPDVFVVISEFSECDRLEKRSSWNNSQSFAYDTFIGKWNEKKKVSYIISVTMPVSSMVLLTKMSPQMC